MPYTDLPTRRSTLDRRALSRTSPVAPEARRVRFLEGPLTSSPDEVNETSESPLGSVGRDRSASLPEPLRDSEDDEAQSSCLKKRVRFTADTRCPSDDSEETLFEGGDEDFDDDMSRFSLSSYRHPYEIRPPSSAYNGRPTPSPQLKSVLKPAGKSSRHLKMDLYTSDASKAQDQWRNIRSMNMLLQCGDGSRIFDPDDPYITGIRKPRTGDVRHDERQRLQLMTYRERRKYLSRARVTFNMTTIANRQRFILILGQALVKFAAPSHRLEAQLLAAARILEVDLETVHLPTTIIACFGRGDEPTSEVHVISRKGALALGALHQVHQVYRSVVHDEVSAREGTKKLEDLLKAKPVCSPSLKICLSFVLSALICPLAFGGSFVDLWIAGAGALILCTVQTHISAKCSTIYANVYDTSVTVLISFVARGLSSIRSQVFCYSAISSSAIIGILPGFLVLCSALELGSKNLVCGSINLVYALIITLFIAFGLQIGSDIFLLFDPNAHTEVTTLAARIASTNTISGTWVSDNASPLGGVFSFTNSSTIIMDDIVRGCYRPDTFPWYLQPFPWWTQFFLVPLFAFCVSLANSQPLFSVDLIVMVFIACVGYTANKVASMFIFNHSDIVSAIGAFAIGLLGNMYSRQFGGTAFTVMVPGVLFLVPSGLSQAGGINSQGDNSGIDTGYEMVEVVVGIVVGLFISQALVYLFGNRKNAASFTF